MKDLQNTEIIKLIFAQNIDEKRIEMLEKMGFVNVNNNGFEYNKEAFYQLPKEHLIGIYNENSRNLKPILL